MTNQTLNMCFADTSCYLNVVFLKNGHSIPFNIAKNMAWFPLGLEIRENLEKWEGIFQSGKSQGILSRLEKSGNFAQNTGKTGKFE